MAVDDWYQRFREENQRQLMEQRRAMEQWIASLKPTTEAITRSYDESTEALARSIEEARSENRQNFEMLIEMIRGLMPKERPPSPVVLEDDVSSNERNQPRIPQEDDRGHPAEDSQAASDNDFSLEIDVIEEPIQETELEGPTQETEFDMLLKDLRIQIEHPKVFSNLLAGIVEVELEKMDGLPDVLRESVKIKWVDYRVSSMDLLETSTAHQLFVKLPVRKTCVVIECVDVSISSAKAKTAYQVFEGMSRSVSTTIFDPGGSFDVLDYEMGEARVIDIVSTGRVGYNSVIGTLFILESTQGCLIWMPFDRGRVVAIQVDEQWVCVSMNTSFPYERGRISVAQTVKQGLSITLFFDPSGVCALRFIKWNGVFTLNFGVQISTFTHDLNGSL